MRIPSSASPDNEARTYGPHFDDREFEEPREEAAAASPLESHERFRKSSASRNSFEDAQNEAAARTEQEDAKPLAARSRYCPRGKAFYRCANGFVGCCSHDPCNPGETCRDRAKASHKKEKSKGATHTQRPATHMTGHSSHTQSHDTPTVTHGTEQQISTKTNSGSSQDTSTSSKTSILTDSPTGGMPSTTSSAPVMSGTPPSCPGGNGTVYTDSHKMEYRIFCGMENTFESYNSVYVSVGGYSQCFSACSPEHKCAGFTFVGTNSDCTGNCYEHTQMPNNTYVQHADDNFKKFVTATKVNSPHNEGTGRISTPSKKGIIAGAIIGTTLFIVVLFFLLFCWRRRKKRIEKRRTTTMIQSTQPQRPIELQSYPSTADPQRQGSTSHDFQPYRGGSYPPPAHTRQRSIYKDQGIRDHNWV